MEPLQQFDLKTT